MRQGGSPGASKPISHPFHCGEWGRGKEGLNLPLPVPFNPGSCAIFVGSCGLFALFQLQKIAHCHIPVVFPIRVLSRVFEG